MKNVTYILKCSDNSLYTGWTNDIKHRLKEKVQNIQEDEGQ